MVCGSTERDRKKCALHPPSPSPRPRACLTGVHLLFGPRRWIQPCPLACFAPNVSGADSHFLTIKTQKGLVCGFGAHAYLGQLKLVHDIHARVRIRQKRAWLSLTISVIGSHHLQTNKNLSLMRGKSLASLTPCSIFVVLLLYTVI